MTGEPGGVTAGLPVGSLGDVFVDAGGIDLEHQAGGGEEMAPPEAR